MPTVNRLIARLATLVVLGLVALAAEPDPLSGQYFGRNKVQYRTFDFRIMQSEHFDVYFYPEEEAAVRDAARMAERWYARLSRILDHQFEERQPLILYATHPHFQQTNVLGGSISEGTGGVTEAFKQRVVMPFAYSYEETDHVLGHELVHAFQYDISGLGRAGGGIEQAARRFQVPLWFIEGMAEYLSVGPVDPLTAMWVRDAALQGDIPSIERMTFDPRVFPYRWGQALWAYVGGRWGDAAIGQILKLTGQGVPYPEAFERILNITLDELSGDWHAAIRRAYLPLLAERPEAREIARPLITQDREGGRLNVGPVVSPDGRYVAFLSELDFLDVELFLADAETGEVIRRLQKGTAFDPHFGSLRYINSAGTFSPDGRQFAFSALRQGRDVLVILDVERAKRVREIPVEGVGEILNPAWSPDGRSIAFTGLTGGIADLFQLDLQTGEARQLTDDPYTELHPAYSPDGSTIAFVTERGPGTDLSQLQYGPYRLALLNLSRNEITLVPGMAGSKNINPQWSRDGQSLYFISTRSGIPNVYRVQIATGDLARVTNLFGGVGGITDISPALTVARGADRLLFTAFEDNGYNIYSLTETAELAGEPIPLLLEGQDTVAPLPAVLPPVPRPQEGAFNRVSLYLRDPTLGLPSPQQAVAFEVIPYRPSLGLDYLGQPQVGVAVGGPFGGAGVQGGIAGIFSDVLGRHTVFGAIQAQGQLDEIGGAVQYINSRGRWNFGGLAQRQPFIYGFPRFGRDEVGDTTLTTYDIVRARFFDSSLQGFAQYPFSTVQRMEFSGGFRRIASDFQLYRFPIDNFGRQVAQAYLEEEEGFSFNMLQGAAALVYDNALLGYTSPFAGQRYRFELAPTFGELQYVQATADYRRYFFARPFTLAFQGLHNGRYLEDLGDESSRQLIRDTYLGYPWLVRGYYDTFSECRGSDQGAVAQDCQLLQQLFGSRVAVAKTELRIPQIGQVAILGGVLPPIEGFLFADAGVAWTADTNPVLELYDPADHSRSTPGEPDPTTGVVSAFERAILTSAGVGARINLFGYMVAEVNYVNAFQRDGWRWQFNFQPGF